MNFDWYYDMPGIFKAVIIAVCIALIIFVLVSAIYHLPQKNKEMKTEQAQIEKEIAKKKVVLANQMKEYINLNEKFIKMKAEYVEFKNKSDHEKAELQAQIDNLNGTIESLKKKVGGRPKKQP